ncbi:Crp/Fnr family transcriptional regulator [Kushneria indalinina]|uniref:Crp/Fnr family transcriptional regulator n=1 Tax=Kushneria indalinina DSM 14324 TaxID=1122140 RepID=A0A3D9DRY9_9GAMM|nr:Crp/Fnr family transcriptional regulator [Kushneria indalinina]REC93497.1 Crp/Fnr family transcriptional regulator [Kushneria indalinina DSM 14324]
MSHQSCMVRHFQYFTDLSDSEIELLCTLEKSPEQMENGSFLWREGEHAEEMAVLSQGWAYSSYVLEDGSRMILDVYMPGDVIGLREYATETHQSTVEAITDCTFCRFPHCHLDHVFRESSRLTNTFFAISAVQQSMLVERMVNLGRRNAQSKLAHFLCEMRSRLAKTNAGALDEFRLPLSQQMLADLMGLTPVHVSRVFSSLRSQSLVYRDRHQITIPDVDKLKAFADFREGYLRMRAKGTGA